MKTTKVYHAPGYPLDPKKDENRLLKSLGVYKVAYPQPTMLEIERQLFGQWARQELECNSR